MFNKIILIEIQLVIKNIKNKFGDTNKNYLNLQNILKDKILSMKQIKNITIWRKATIKCCANIAVEMTGDRNSYVGVNYVS